MRQAKRKENKAMMNLQESKKNALQAYKEAKNNYLQNMTAENWREFCEAKMNCMRLGVIIQARKKDFFRGSVPRIAFT